MTVRVASLSRWSLGSQENSQELFEFEAPAPVTGQPQVLSAAALEPVAISVMTRNEFVLPVVDPDPPLEHNATACDSIHRKYRAK